MLEANGNGHRPGQPLRLSAIVAATDRPATLERSLAGIDSASEPPEEVLVVDSPAGLGPAAARNAGVQGATGDVLVFIDSDVIPHPDAFVRLRRRFESDRQLAGVFGAYDAYPEGEGVVSTFRNLLPHHVHHRSEGPSRSFWAGLGAVRRNAFLAVGGFDAERYPGPHVEDIDLGLRLADAGHRMELDASVQGKHLKQWGFGQMLRTDLLFRGAPWVSLMLHHRSAPLELNLSHRHRLTALSTLVAVGALARRRPGLALAALGVQVGLNRQLYGLLRQRVGTAGMVAGVGLHSVHHLTAAASVPIGVASWSRDRGRRRARAAA